MRSAWRTIRGARRRLKVDIDDDGGPEAMTQLECTRRFLRHHGIYWTNFTGRIRVTPRRKWF
jgi:hypothetical protein